MDWITDLIAIGNFHDARSPELGQHVDAVLCLKEECCDEDGDHPIVLSVPLEDGYGNTRKMVNDALGFIHDAVSNSEKILVHCHAGRSRSVCIVAAYLVKYNGYTRNSALTFIQSKREIYLSDGIDEIFGLVEF